MKSNPADKAGNGEGGERALRESIDFAKMAGLLKKYGMEKVTSSKGMNRNHFD
jgi:hypothetical protein